MIRIMPVITQVGGLTGGAIREQIFILVMYTLGVGMMLFSFVDNFSDGQFKKQVPKNRPVEFEFCRAILLTKNGKASHPHSPRKMIAS
jgi:hypothetical protein